MPELNKINQPNFTNVQSKLSIKYPKLAKVISALTKLYYYEQKQNKKQYFIALISYVKSYSDNLNHDQLNQYAWEIFESSNNPTQLQEAIKWVKLALSKKEHAMYLDTYACLLYKLGRAKEAIEWETKAASIATEEDKATIEATLKKMKEGKKIRINQWAP